MLVKQHASIVSATPTGDTMCQVAMTFWATQPCIHLFLLLKQHASILNPNLTDDNICQVIGFNWQHSQCIHLFMLLKQPEQDEEEVLQTADAGQNVA